MSFRSIIAEFYEKTLPMTFCNNTFTVDTTLVLHFFNLKNRYDVDQIKSTV